MDLFLERVKYCEEQYSNNVCDNVNGFKVILTEELLNMRKLYVSELANGHFRYDMQGIEGNDTMYCEEGYIILRGSRVISLSELFPLAPWNGHIAEEYLSSELTVFDDNKLFLFNNAIKVKELIRLFNCTAKNTTIRSYEQQKTRLDHDHALRALKLISSKSTYFTSYLFHLLKYANTDFYRHYYNNHIFHIWGSIDSLSADELNTWMIGLYSTKWWTFSSGKECLNHLKNKSSEWYKIERIVGQKVSESCLSWICNAEMICGRTVFTFDWPSEIEARCNIKPFTGIQGEPFTANSDTDWNYHIHQVYLDLSEHWIPTPAHDFFDLRSSWASDGSSNLKGKWLKQSGFTRDVKKTSEYDEFSLLKKRKSSHPEFSDEYVMRRRYLLSIGVNESYIYNNFGIIDASDRLFAIEYKRNLINSTFDKSMRDDISHVRLTKTTAVEQISTESFKLHLKNVSAMLYSVFDKKECGKIKGRSLFAVDVHTYLAECMIFQNLEDMLENVGWDGHGHSNFNGTKRFYDFMNFPKSRSDSYAVSYCCGDWSDFNAHHSTENIIKVYELVFMINRSFQQNPDDAEFLTLCMDYLRKAFQNQFALCPREYLSSELAESNLNEARSLGINIDNSSTHSVIKIKHGLCSGLRCTDLVNTILNRAMIMGAMKHVCAIFPSIGEYDSIHAGDDFVLRCFNFAAAQVLIYSLLVSGSSMAASKQFIHFSHIDYLRRRISSSSSSKYGARVLLPSLLPSIENSPALDAISIAKIESDLILELQKIKCSSSLVKACIEHMLLKASDRANNHNSRGLVVSERQLRTPSIKGGIGLFWCSHYYYDGTCKLGDPILPHFYHKFVDYNTYGIDRLVYKFLKKCNDLNVNVPATVMRRMVDDVRKNVLIISSPADDKVRIMRAETNKVKESWKEADLIAISQKRYYGIKELLVYYDTLMSFIGYDVFNDNRKLLEVIKYKDMSRKEIFHSVGNYCYILYPIISREIAQQIRSILVTVRKVLDGADIEDFYCPNYRVLKIILYGPFGHNYHSYIRTNPDPGVHILSLLAMLSNSIGTDKFADVMSMASELTSQDINDILEAKSCPLLKAIGGSELEHVVGELCLNESLKRHQSHKSLMGQLSVVLSEMFLFSTVSSYILSATKMCNFHQFP